MWQMDLEKVNYFTLKKIYIERMYAKIWSDDRQSLV